jgi:NAD(P)-dependent dehydrogenase (short-subunit alcohol dehydrogenase family)
VSRWTEADIPDQSGRTVLVTGANSGLGLQTAMVLAERAATVLLACRDPHRGQAALARVRSRAAADATLGPGARVVTVSSLAHRGGRLDVDDLNFERRLYNPAAAYSASKLANLLFTFELDRRARAAGRDLVAPPLPASPPPN